jgi:hypothetical protein
MEEMELRYYLSEKTS